MNDDLQPVDAGTNDGHEPTVLDLYKSVTRDWPSFLSFVRTLWDARRREELNRSLQAEAARAVTIEEVRPQDPARVEYFPWRSVLALFLALAAQFFLDKADAQAGLGPALYLFAAVFAVWAAIRGEWHLPSLPVFMQMPEPLSTHVIPFVLSILFALAAFWSFGGGLFTALNLGLWIAAVALLAYSLWLKNPRIAQAAADPQKKLLWNVALVLVFAAALFFRLYRTDSVPVEPFSDHAEKILDVYEITLGKTSIFFERNTGREAIQMYWTLLVAKVFGSGLSYLSLKLGTALLGILTLPYIYLLGREYGNERVGLLALFLFGIAYWPNVISRIGLRFPLYPLFAAPVLYHLVRGLRTRNRNDFIMAGLFLGLGLHGYSPFRIVPILVLAAFVIYVLHERSQEDRRRAFMWLVVVVSASLFVFLPLLRYWMEHPDQFGYRAFSRLGSVETALPGPAWQIFLSNLVRGLLMFNWDDGEIWVNSMPHRPALDIVTGALFVLGLLLMIIRYARQRDWRDLLLLVSIPLLLMPSILSLAFPGENPALNRAGAGAIPAILVSVLAFEGLLSSLRAEHNARRGFIAYGLAAILLFTSAAQNYDIVFNQFDRNFRNGAWNTSEMGQVISDFESRYGRTDTIWIVPFPYWVDTRLPGVWAGIPNRDFALWPENLSESLGQPAPKLFIFWPEDLKTEGILKDLYPDGALTRYASAFPGKDFMMYFVEK